MDCLHRAKYLLSFHLLSPNYHHWSTHSIYCTFTIFMLFLFMCGWGLFYYIKVLGFLTCHFHVKHMVHIIYFITRVSYCDYEIEKKQILIYVLIINRLMKLLLINIPSNHYRWFWLYASKSLHGSKKILLVKYTSLVLLSSETLLLTAWVGWLTY